MDNVYYKVMFDDGDIDIELYPYEDDENFEDYDNTDLEQVKAYAKQFAGARIVKLKEKEVKWVK